MTAAHRPHDPQYHPGKRLGAPRAVIHIRILINTSDVPIVTLAKAGVQGYRAGRGRPWVPASAGMTRLHGWMRIMKSGGQRAKGAKLCLRVKSCRAST